MVDDRRDNFDFDVALSFAGEDREYVEEVNKALQARGVKTFLDSDHLSETWGEDLGEFFDAVYRKRSRYAILFISRHYADKMWPRHERRSALARALEERGAYVLPIRLDDTEVMGLHPTLGYLDARRVGISGLIEAFAAKLTGRSSLTNGWPGDRAPRTQHEVEQVRSEQPPGWEYLYFAGVLHIGKEALEGKYLDHEIGYATPSGERIGDQAAIPFVQTVLDDAKALMRVFKSVLGPEIQERAFGTPGTTGDPERIKRLAERWTSIYEGFLDWSARIRGTSHGEKFAPLFMSLAGFFDEAIHEYRQFVDAFISSVDRIPTALAAGENVEIKMTLTLTISDERLKSFSVELERLAHEMGMTIDESEVE